ncbi:MAG TPA: hypothetical protein VFP59_13960 [Candidatus Angelobacter sp.]|nr:hypothetical protein [Candidatus Angelobacter sp.]
MRDSSQPRWVTRRIFWGKIILLLYILAAFTRKAFPCAVVDTDGSLDCLRTEAAGIVLDKVLWIRCKQKRGGHELQSFKCGRKDRSSSAHNCDTYHANRDIYRATRDTYHANHNAYHKNDVKETDRQQKGQSSSANDAKSEQSQKLNLLEQAFKATDILLHNGGFALIAVDLSSIDEARLRKVPLTTWFRFARVAHETQTALVFLTSSPIACSSLGVKLRIYDGSASWSNNAAGSVEDFSIPGPPKKPEKKSNAQLQELWDLTDSYSPHKDINPVDDEVRTGGNRLSVAQYPRVRVHEYPAHMNILQSIESKIDFTVGKKPAQQARLACTEVSIYK